ncbi:MAG: adenosylcobinamide-GDP ribazoletransferase [bacterium]|nr:adenosylcobinamide-GDP ribazoletransferase [bacterium]
MVKNIVSAFQFLTIFPLPVKTDARNLARSLAWFPLAGAVIGGCTGFAYWLLHHRLTFPGNSAAALTILIYIIVTRGLHLDGFMDTIDGFFSRKERTLVLKIMKEPTVGSFAVLGIGVWFLLLFSSIPMLHPMDVVFLHTVTRFQVLLPPLFFSYPRESGTGKFFVEQVTKTTALAAFTLVLGITAAIYWLDPAVRGRLPLYGGCLALAVVITLVCAAWSKKKIGGITGDILGFTIESTHMLMVLLIPIASNAVH